MIGHTIFSDYRIMERVCGGGARQSNLMVSGGCLYSEDESDGGI